MKNLAIALNVFGQYLMAVGACPGPCPTMDHNTAAITSPNFRCGAFDFVKIDRYVVQNDVWGGNTPPSANAIREYRQCILRAENRKGFIYAEYSWEISNSIGDIISYPHVQYDIKPPISQGIDRHRQPIRSSVKYTIEASGIYNASYDVWLKVGAENDQPVELMIWLDYNIKQNTPSIGRVYIGNYLFDVHVKEQKNAKGSWDYVAIVSRQKLTKLDFNIDKVVAMALASARIGGPYHIESVQFGSEIAQGRGSLVIENFRVY